jgi:hypothetical protein
MIKNWQKLHYLYIWITFFVCTAFVVVLVQFVLLPYVFPQWVLSQGFSMPFVIPDCNRFHVAAVELAREIKTEGWSVWQLRPKGQGPVGIAAVIYALTFPNSWMLIPMHAAIHAFSGVILYLIVLTFLQKRKAALIAVLPFVLFPSAMTWYAQLHKDSFSIFGSLLIIYGWLILAKHDTWGNWLKSLYGIISIIIGAFFVWIMRPYHVQLLQLFSIVIFLLLSVTILCFLLRSKISIKKATLAIIFNLAALYSFQLMPDISLIGGVVTLTPPEQIKTVQLERQRQIEDELREQEEYLELEMEALEVKLKSYLGKTITIEEILSKEIHLLGIVARKEIQLLGLMARKEIQLLGLMARNEPEWKNIPMVPDFIEGKLYGISNRRNNFISGYRYAGSRIDTDIRFHSIIDIIEYLPRALQIAFFAPFPSDWFKKGTTSVNTFTRRVIGFEMIVVYISLMFLPYVIWLWRKRPELWVVLILAVSLLLIYALAIPNLGTLYRMRYCYTMILVALCIAGALELRSKYKNKIKKIAGGKGSHLVT